MKSFQLRLSDDVHEAVKELADIRETTIADIVRQSLEVYAIAVTYAMEGKRLVWEDPATGEKAHVLIPGLTMLKRRRTREDVETDLTSQAR